MHAASKTASPCYRKNKGIGQKDFIAQMQTMGCDISPTSYSKLEGQLRHNGQGSFRYLKNSRCKYGRFNKQNINILFILLPQVFYCGSFLFSFYPFFY